MSEQPTRSSSFGAVVLATAATIMASLPVFLTGALAVEVTGDLAFGAAALGIAIAVFRGSGALASPLLGRLSDRLGARASMRVAASISAVATAGVAASAVNWGTLVAWLMFASLAVTLTEGAANRLLIDNVPQGRRGLAFGIKQAALPGAGMIAGMSVPLIALTLGWRYAFGLGTLLALGVLIGTRAAPEPPPGSGQGATVGRLADRASVLLLGGSFGLSMAANQTIPVFYVDAAVRAGSSQRLAGTLLAVASAATIVNRLVWGAIADRMSGGHLRLCAGGMAVGAMGFVLLALSTPVTMTIGVVVALVGTWGFSGVFWYALMQAYPEAPGRLTGAVLPLGLLGGMSGPLVFGVVVELLGYPVAWTLSVGLAIVGAAGMTLATRRVARKQAAAEASADRHGHLEVT